MLCLIARLCPTVCNPMDHGRSGSSVRGIFFRQESWNGLPFPPPGDLPDPGIKPQSPALQILYLLSHQGSPGVYVSLQFKGKRVFLRYSKAYSDWVFSILNFKAFTQLHSQPILCCSNLYGSNNKYIFRLSITILFHQVYEFLVSNYQCFEMCLTLRDYH